MIHQCQQSVQVEWIHVIKIIMLHIHFESIVNSIQIKSIEQTCHTKTLILHQSWQSLKFESDSRLTWIESEAFSSPWLESIKICRNDSILGSSYFSYGDSRSSLWFEFGSRLTGIGSEAFRFSSLQSMQIPRSARFVDCSATVSSRLYSISIEAGHDRFVTKNDILIDIIDHRLIRFFEIMSHWNHEHQWNCWIIMSFIL
jgi:hypothetical protein